jgi:hypothetical protein
MIFGLGRVCAVQMEAFAAMLSSSKATRWVSLLGNSDLTLYAGFSSLRAAGD